jgi:hypothetical protein
MKRQERKWWRRKRGDCRGELAARGVGGGLYLPAVFVLYDGGVLSPMPCCSIIARHCLA